MPCRDDPEDYERNKPDNIRRLKVSKLYCWAHYALGMGINHQAKLDSQSEILRKDYAPELCDLLSKVTDKSYKEYLFHSPSEISAELNLWWIKHQEFDKARKAEERKLAEKLELKNKALSKLTPEERKALDLD
jgi:hypothetical protein